MKSLILIRYYGFCDKFEVNTYDIILEFKHRYRVKSQHGKLEVTVYKKNIGEIQYCHFNYADSDLWINGSCLEEDIEKWKVKLKTEYLKNRRI